MTAPEVTRVIRPAPALMSRLLSLRKAADDLAAKAPDILAHPAVTRAMEQALVRVMVAVVTEADTEEGSRSCRRGLDVMRRFG